MEMAIELSTELATKLHPRRFTAMSGKMAAIVAHILGEHWTGPEITELVITGDGYVLAQRAGDVGCNDIIGSAQDLERNVANLLAVAELTPEEKKTWDILYRARVTDWRNGRRTKGGTAWHGSLSTTAGSTPTPTPR